MASSCPPAVPHPPSDRVPAAGCGSGNHWTRTCRSRSWTRAHARPAAARTKRPSRPRSGASHTSGAASGNPARRPARARPGRRRTGHRSRPARSAAPAPTATSPGCPPPRAAAGRPRPTAGEPPRTTATRPAHCAAWAASPSSPCRTAPGTRRNGRSPAPWRCGAGRPGPDRILPGGEALSRGSSACRMTLPYWSFGKVLWRVSVGVVLVAGSSSGSLASIGGSGMRAFAVRLPSGQRYWTVLDEDLRVVAVADAFLRHQRFGRDGAESTTKAYAHAIALFFRWCARSGRSWQAGAGQFASFMTWLAHAGPSVSGAGDGGAGSGVLLAGPGAAAARSASRINGVLTAVRGMVVHAVSTGQAPAGLVSVLYEVADDRDLPGQGRGEEGRMAWRLRARHRLREPETAVDRASDEEIVALLGACRSARDRLIVLLMARAGLRRGEVCGLRRSDVHLLVDSRRLGCEVARAHLHVVRREDNPNGAWAKSPRARRRQPVTATALAKTLPAAGASSEFPHVLSRVVLDGAAARLAGMLDRGLLEEAGWDPATRILFLPAQHRLLGRQVCRAERCTGTVHNDCPGVCYRCFTRLQQLGMSATDIAAAGRLPAAPAPAEDCAVPSASFPRSLILVAF